jgi:tetratricopeptide (TPR) repeat protein
LGKGPADPFAANIGARGDAYYFLKMYDNAVADFAEILQIDPDYPMEDLKMLYPLYEERYGLD